MKKILFFVFVLSAFSVSARSQSEFAPLSATIEDRHATDKSDERFAAKEIDEKDREMAATIKRLTNRSIVGLTEKKVRGGAFLLDLQGRFQNVMLAKLDADNETSAACITGLDEANEFFGKNLETGEPVASDRLQKDDSATLAARYGMSGDEFMFYQNLIEEAAIHRQQSPNSATISIVNADGAGEGFNDTTSAVPEGGNTGTTLGQQRLNLFNYAASIWGAFLDTSVPIKVNSKFDPLTCTATSATLGSAGASYVDRNFTNAPFANTYYHAALANKISGSVSAGAPYSYQISATFNSSVNSQAGCLAAERFYYGFDNSTPSGTVNLLVVLLHEMGHGLGFSSFVNGSTGALLNGQADVYTRFMYDSTTGKYWYQMTDTERQVSALNNGNVWWDGPNVKIASSFLTAGRDTATGRVKLYTPTTLQNGSSISHWDTSATTNLLMEPAINLGLPTTLDLTRQQMRDIGWFRDSNADGSTDTISGVQTTSSLIVGSSAMVSWTNNGGFSKNVTIELSTDGGATFPTTIASDVTNTGSYSFTVPNNVTTQARVRVREANFYSPQNFSASNFNIQLAPTAANVSTTGKVTDSKGRSISNAKVTAVKTDGTVIYTVTDLRGYYQLDGINAGETCAFQVTHKLFTFAPRVVTINADLSSLNFVAISAVRGK